MIIRIGLILLNFLSILVSYTFFSAFLPISPLPFLGNLSYFSSIICIITWGCLGMLFGACLGIPITFKFLKMHLIDPNTRIKELQFLPDMLQSICAQSNISPLPKLAIYRSHEANSFTIGPSKHYCVVALSTGLIQRLSAKEIKGILAHELAHVKSRNAITLSYLMSFHLFFVLIPCKIISSIVGALLPSSRKEIATTLFIFFYFYFEILFMSVARAVNASFVRSQKYSADFLSKAILKNEGKREMILALKALQRSPFQHTNKYSPLKPFSNHAPPSFVSMFSFHPSIRNRIDLLERSS